MRHANNSQNESYDEAPATEEQRFPSHVKSCRSIEKAYNNCSSTFIFRTVSHIAV